jgi:hypothetical protein
MSMQRRHNKSPSKQYVPMHAPVSGYPGHDNAQEFQQTAKVGQPVPPAPTQAVDDMSGLTNAMPMAGNR